MIDSATPYPIHALLSHEGNLMYRIPPYQREYSWQKLQWEELFEDLVEADGSHFLGTIITLNKTTDAVQAGVLELIDGQQRMTTLTLLLASIYSVLKENYEELDEDARTDLTNLGRQLVRKSDGEPRVTPQKQGHNRDDYRQVLSEAGLNVDATLKPYYPARKMSKCYHYFRDAISKLAEAGGQPPVDASLRMLEAAKQAILVKIEVASHADAFVLFASLNNRGMPLTPVDLIKNHVLAEAERKNIMPVDDAFKLWNQMLTNLGDSSANQERFLRHYYNAFKSELPEVPNAPVATKTRLIRIFETLLAHDLQARIQALVDASRIYGRVTCATETDDPTDLDESLRRLLRAQGAPSYVLMMWLISKQTHLGLTDDQLVAVTDRLTSFFVRRNLTGSPQTYALPGLFMAIIEKLTDLAGDAIVSTTTKELVDVSSSDEEFHKRLEGPIYVENTDVARFVLTTLAEDAMTKETRTDLWVQEKGHYVWTIEHVLPQGANLPAAWIEMLGGASAAGDAQEVEVHRLGNLTITAFNSTLSNKSFPDKRERVDSAGRYIGYRNGFSLNSSLAAKESWTVADIDARTDELASEVIARFQL
jgi:Protein of unknown function DUF262/Protein of unknown function (DUF1524)